MAASSRSGGREGRNSGRAWDERNDFSLGRRGTDSAFDVDLKETDNKSYRLVLADLVATDTIAASQGYQGLLQVVFKKNGEVLGDYTVVRTDVFDEMRKHQ